METLFRESGGVLNGIHRIQWELFRGECDIDGRRCIKIPTAGFDTVFCRTWTCTRRSLTAGSITYNVTPSFPPPLHTRLMQHLGSVTQPRVSEVRSKHLRALIEPEPKEIESYGMEWCVGEVHMKISITELTDPVAFDTSSFAVTTDCIAHSSGAVLCSIPILGLGLAERS